MNELSYIKSEALSLSVGDTEHVFCCFCDNCKPYSPSLSITRIDTGILYNCYRVCCSGQGFIGTLPSNLIETKSKKKEFIPKFYSKSTETLGRYNLAHMLDCYGITEHEIKGNWINKIRGRDGLLIPLFNSLGYSYGHTTKYFDADKKAIHYLTTDTCKLHYAKSLRVQDTIILVEDVLSAIRVSRFHQGVALLGTHLNGAQVKDLLSTGCRNIIVALDPDALDKAIKMKNKFGLFFNTFKVVSLTKDPKNLNHDQLKKELGLCT